MKQSVFCQSPALAEDLVHHDPGLLLRACRQPAHAHVGLVLLGQVAAFAVVEQTEIVVADVAVGGAERFLALIAQQEVVGRIGAPVAGEHAVVPTGVAHQQQVSGHVGLGLGPVVEHLQVAAVGIGIGGAAAELVEQLIGRHDADAQAVLLLVELLQPERLRQQLLRRGNDDDHIGGRVGMVVLIGDAIEQLGHGKGRRREVGRRSRRGHGQRQIIQPHGALAGRLAQADDVALAQQAAELEGLRLAASLRRVAKDRRDVHLAHHRVVHLDAHHAQAVIAQRHGQRAAVGMSSQFIGGIRAGRHGRLLKKLAPAVIPGKLIGLV